jgi:hypothetical protein
MKVQLLYFPDCPNAEPARAALREAIRQEQLDVDVEEIDTSRDAAPRWSKGWGSPTTESATSRRSWSTSSTMSDTRPLSFATRPGSHA